MTGRVRAAQRLAKYPTEDVVDALKTTVLKEPFWGVQAAAAKALGTIRTSPALRALIAGLKTKHPKARRAVVKALGEFRDEEVAKALIGALDEGDPSYFVEGEAARSLGKTRSPKAFDVLKKNLRKESFNETIRIGVLDGYAELKDVQAIPIIIEWTRYGKPHPAARSLGKTRSPKAFDVLKKNLRKESFNETIRIGVLDGYAELRDTQAIPIIIEWTRYGKPHPAREAATKALGKLGEGKPEVTDHLAHLLDDPWFRVRLEAAVALGELLDPKAVGPLERLIERELDGRVKRRAREAVRKIQAGREASDDFRRLREDVDKLREENRQLKERLDSIEKPQTRK